MFLMPFFFGLIVGLPFALILLRIFRGRFLMITSPYFAGALYGFWLWILSIGILFLDASYDFAGIAFSEYGSSFMGLVFSGFAGAGFISGGILAALVLKTFYRK